MFRKIGFFINFVAALVSASLSAPGYADERVKDIPVGYSLTTQLIGATTIPEMKLSVTGYPDTVSVSLEKVCFPDCTKNTRFERFENLFKGFGITEEQMNGITKVNINYLRVKTICKLSERETAALLCYKQNADAGDVEVSFEKLDGTKMRPIIEGYFSIDIATRVINGFTTDFYGQTPYLLHDLRISAVGKKLNDAAQATYGVAEYKNVHMHDILVNGVHNP